MSTTTNLLRIALLLLLAYVGFLFGEMVGDELLGIGFSLTVIVLAMIVIQRSPENNLKWIFVLIMSWIFLSSYWIGGLTTFLLSIGSGVACIVGMIIIASSFVGGVQGEKIPIWNFVEVLVGVKGFQIVDKGNVLWSRSRLFGPKILIIHPGNVVILVKLPDVGRMSGPGILSLTQFEYVKAVYDITPKLAEISLTDVFVPDFGKVKIDATISYQIKISKRVADGKNDLSNIEMDIIQKIDHHIADWQTFVLKIVEATIRNVSSDRVGSEGISRHIEAEATRIARKKTDTFGIYIANIRIINFQPDERFWQRYYWIESEKAKISLQAQREQLAHAYTAAKEMGADEDPIRQVMTDFNDAKGLVPDTQDINERALARLTLDKDINEFDDTDLRHLVNKIAENIDFEDIQVSYVLPGSVLITLEMAEDAAHRLMDLYMYSDPIIEELGITEVRISRVLPSATQKERHFSLLPSAYIDYDYDFGLDRLREIIASDADHLQAELATLEARWRDIERDIRSFGVNDNIRSQRAQVINSLNHLANQVNSEKSFTDLCKK